MRILSLRDLRLAGSPWALGPKPAPRSRLLEYAKSGSRRSNQVRIEDWQALGLEGEQGTNELHTGHAFAAARALAPKPAPAAALRVAALRVATLTKSVELSGPLRDDLELPIPLVGPRPKPQALPKEPQS